NAIAVTSIGLDGEAFDTLSAKPKPRIIVYKGMIVATAKGALKEGTAKCHILYETALQTPLGKVVIGKVINTGSVLLAGPSTNQGLKRIKAILKQLAVDKLLIDGALFRKSFANHCITEAVIVVSGAVYSKNMFHLIDDTRSIIDGLSLEHIDCDPLSQTIKWAIKDAEFNIIKSGSKPLSIHPSQLDTIIDTPFQYLHIKGALNDSLAQTLLAHRNRVQHKTLIIDDAVQLLCAFKQFRYLQTIQLKIVTRHHIDVPFIAINPFSPSGYSYDSVAMKTAFETAFQYPIINVKTDVEVNDE
ncbi:MAG: hypothetical protein K9L26_04115, partial [Candidatus Izimaplasma sp.]|nr:hypothetical protein [Candidatus Izimaplasma bacterium]